MKGISELASRLVQIRAKRLDLERQADEVLPT